MRKWIPVAIAALVAINLVIFQSAHLADTKVVEADSSKPRLLPSMADAKPLRPDATASRIESYNDTGFILTGQPTRKATEHPIQQVSYLDTQRSARQQPPTQQPTARQPVSPTRQMRVPRQQPAARQQPRPAAYGPVAQPRPQTASQPRQLAQRPPAQADQFLNQLPPESDPAFYQAAMQLAHGNIPMDQLERLHQPGPYQPPPHDGQRYQQWPQQSHQQAPQYQQRPQQPYSQQRRAQQHGPQPRQQPPRQWPITTRQAVPAHANQQYPVRLAQSQAEVENLLLGNPDVPPPPGFKPPPAEKLKPIAAAKNAVQNPADAVAAPAETLPQAPANQNNGALRFPDQSPGEYATSPQVGGGQGGGAQGGNAGANGSSPGNQARPVEQVPKPGEKLTAETLPTPADSTDVPPVNGDRFAPSPDENLLQPGMGESETGAGNTQNQSPGKTDQTNPGQQNENGSTGQGNPAQNKPAVGGASKSPAATTSDDPHYDVFANSQFPSARECGECHKQIFEEWSVSNHAYAAISPMFHRFEQTINSLARGTIGYFCMRCHATVATTLNHPREKSIWESIPAAHEGVTCITCHRVREHYSKVNGERRIVPGDIFEPVSGSGHGERLREIIAKKEHYKVKTAHGEKGPGQNIHTKVIHFEQISQSDFCVSCHQVAVYPGIALEVVWAQYRASPACKEGISCQDCHMGAVPGKPYGYDTAPIAVVGGKEIDPGRKHSNHMFVGPGYSIAHPGVFPFRNKKVDDEDWTPQEWNQFDYRAGWGTDNFEKAVEDGHIKASFPEVWENSDDRVDARELLDKNLEKLATKKRLRHQLMEDSSKIEGPIFKRQPRVGKRLNFKYLIKNISNGHNMPSGSLGAQPQLWVNVALTGPDGRHLWESGYVDCNGDIADLHSMEVAKGRIKRDQQLVNFQTKFLIQHVKGPDREMYLPIPVDQDQLPFIRPAGLPITVLNHPPTIRMEAHSVPPLGAKEAKYHVPAKLMAQPGVYQLHIRMRSRAEPIYFMRFCRATPEMERRMNERMLNYHEHSTSFVVQ